jgi:cobalt-precorrin-5B (C1)-methyltransferase
MDVGASNENGRRPTGPLRRGWTTGACATAAAKAAWQALLTGEFPDPVTIRLPRGETPSFALCRHALGVSDAGGEATASIIKDAGDDPDVTHGAEIVATVRRAAPGAGVVFRAGPGVGTVTLAGLPIAPGEPAINPVPRRMILEALGEVAASAGVAADAEVTIAVTGGEALAEKTWNPRLGILGGISILGTTGIVVPFSCAAWIHSIHRGIDVARAAGLAHVAGSTGNVSEAAVKARHDLPDIALLDMGDFAGGLLKYIREHPLPRLTLSGGFGKMTKLAQGALDLHSSRSEVDRAFLAGLAGSGPAWSRIVAANTAAEALAIAGESGIPLADRVAEKALATARGVLGGVPIRLGVLIVDRSGTILAERADG